MPITMPREGNPGYSERKPWSDFERYDLLPFWYTIFSEAGRTGMPVMRYV
jgi:hypothetical protein